MEHEHRANERRHGMTREQAKREVDLIDFYLQNHTDDYGEESHTAMMMAIKALEQQTCEDAVSRAEAMTEIMMFTGNVKTDEEDIYIKVSDAVQLLRELPPVKPQYTEDEIQKMQELEQAEIEKAYELGKAEQQRVGHWEKMVEVYDLQQNRMLVPYSYDDSKFGNTPVYVCDCGCESNKNSRFCPDCGAKMVELQESEVSE